jgi:predicted nucleotide-binding protein (sugar kinase/HSP70/actin superfamily)
MRQALEQGLGKAFEEKLLELSRDLGKIPLQRPVGEVPVISLIGEIFVRRDGISRRNLTEHLALKGFAVSCSPVMEWLYYLDYLGLHNQGNRMLGVKEKLGLFIKNRLKQGYEHRLKSILSQSGLVPDHAIDMKTIVKNGQDHVSINLGGEAILTVGSALTEIASHACGVISIGPFGCMPTRIAEAILIENMNREGKLATLSRDPDMEALLAQAEDLPFLSIESDGSPFPQLITAKLETFCLRALRLNESMQNQRKTP